MIIIFPGHPKTLDEFTYDDKDINDIIVECMSNTSMVGIQGSIAFGEGGDPIRNVKIERVQGNKSVPLLTPRGLLPFLFIRRLWPCINRLTKIYLEYQAPTKSI